LEAIDPEAQAADVILERRGAFRENGLVLGGCGRRLAGAEYLLAGRAHEIDETHGMLLPGGGSRWSWARPSRTHAPERAGWQPSPRRARARDDHRRELTLATPAGYVF